MNADNHSEIMISNKLLLSNIPPEFIKRVQGELTINNPQYLENKKYRRWNGQTPKKLYFYKESEKGLTLPRGYIDRLTFLCEEYQINVIIKDKTTILPKINFNFNGKLRPIQKLAINDMMDFDIGVLNAPTGSGKTIMGLYLIAMSNQPTLIIVHTTDLLNQWIQRIETFLEIPKKDIGIIGAGQKRIGKQITVALVQSLYKHAKKVAPYIGHIIVDECHRTPSRTFTQAVTNFDCRYILGLSATTYRRDGLSKLIFLYLGEKRHEIDKEALIKNKDIMRPEIITRNTTFRTNLCPAQEYSKMITELIQNKERNNLICKDIEKEVKNNNVCLVLSDRKEHCNLLQKNLFNHFGIASELLTGDIANEERQIITNKLNNGQVKVLVATGQLIGEGFDCKALSVLFLATPVSFSGRIIQYVGRILRPAKGKEKAILYDYVDIEIGVLRASARARNKALVV